ncbi:MAG: TetR/AcrR family transcriptional regulator, partial [Leptospirales bacterium]
MVAPRASGRPRRSRNETAEKRAEIISAARRLFAEEGFESVSIRRLMNAVGLSPMMFYQFFPHKRAVLRHIWTDIFQEFFQTCETATGRRRAAGAQLKAYLTAAIRFWLDHPDRYRMIYMYEDQAEDKADELYATTPGALARLEFPRDIIVRGIERGEFRRVDVDLTLQSLIVLIHGLAYSLVTIPEFPWT